MQIKLANIFTNHMVLEMNKEISVFGDGPKSSILLIKLMDGDEAISQNSASTKEDGSFETILPPVPAGGPYKLVAYVVDGCTSPDKEKLEINDVMVGRVILCGGQSNMEFKLAETNYDLSKATDNKLVRTTDVYRIGEMENLTPNTTPWRVLTNENAGTFSAIGYFIANEIAERENIAVGVINCSQGASIIEAWMPKGSSKKFGVPEDEKHLDHRFPDFQSFNQEGLLYEKMLKPIAPYTIESFVWYQGESDTTVAEAKVYKYELADFFNEVKRIFDAPTLRIIEVQINDFDPRNDDGWHMLQKAQEEITDLVPNTKVVKINDISETDMIHPVTKDKMSKRIVKELLA